MSPYIYIYIILYLCLILQTKHYRRKPQYAITLMMYSLAGICACYMCFFAWPYNIQKYYLEAIIYHCIALYLWIKPTEQLCKFNDESLCYAAPSVLNFLTYLVIICSMTALIYSCTNIDISVIMADVREFRSELPSNINDEASFIGYLSAFAHSYWSVAIVLAFYYIIYYPYKKIQIALLFISSLYIVIYGISNAGREYFVKYGFVVIMLYMIFKNEISDVIKSRIKKVGIVLIGFFLAVFMIITYARFGLSRSENYENVGNSIIYYLGQGHCNFSQYYEAFGHGQWGGAMIFPFFVGHTIQHHNLYELVSVDFRLNTFSTSIGDIVSDVGSVVAFVLVVMYAFFVRYVGRRKFDIFTIIYASWIYDYTFSGLFFFHDHFSRFRVISILLIIVLDIVNRQYLQTRRGVNNLKTGFKKC